MKIFRQLTRTQQTKNNPCDLTENLDFAFHVIFCQLYLFQKLQKRRYDTLDIFQKLFKTECG